VHKNYEQGWWQGVSGEDEGLAVVVAHEGADAAVVVVCIVGGI